MKACHVQAVSLRQKLCCGSEPRSHSFYPFSMNASFQLTCVVNAGHASNRQPESEGVDRRQALSRAWNAALSLSAASLALATAGSPPATAGWLGLPFGGKLDVRCLPHLVARPVGMCPCIYCTQRTVVSVKTAIDPDRDLHMSDSYYHPCFGYDSGRDITPKLGVTPSRTEPFRTRFGFIQRS